MKELAKYPLGAFDVYYNKKEKIYQFVFIKYNMETKEASITKVIDIGKEKYKALFQAEELISRRLLLDQGV